MPSLFPEKSDYKPMARGTILTTNKEKEESGEKRGNSRLMHDEIGIR